MSNDAELLQRYVGQNDERAFTELVRRYLGLVYAAALRRTNGRTHLAEEIAQKVFSDFARKAPALAGHPAVTGWLYRTTRYVAIDAIRAEQRREKLTEALRVMPDDPTSASAPVDWERLHPVIDEALDQLKERDREILLLRFFNGLPYAEVGQRFDLTENAARMRAERALDRLRVLLGQRGITSTAVALGLLLANPAFAAAPAHLAPAIATSVLAAATAQTGAAGFASFLLMNKITLPVVSAALAAGLTTVVWTATASDHGHEELNSLRRENARLVAQASTSATTSNAPKNANAGQAVNTTDAIVAAWDERQAHRAQAGASSGPATPQGAAPVHRNRGQATPQDAGFTLAWAGTIGDVDALSHLIWFDDDARQAAVDIIAGLPEATRRRYPTPEAFYGFLFALDGVLLAPPPRAEVMERMAGEFEFVEIAPGRVAARRKGTTRNFQVYQQTAEGWKIVIPKAGVVAMPNNLNGDVLAKFGSP